MELLINTLQNIPGIAKTESFIALEQPVDRQINLDEESILNEE